RERVQLACCRDEEPRGSRTSQRFRVAAHEVDRVESIELVPGQPGVAPGRAELLAEHRDRALAARVYEAEGAPLRRRIDHRVHGHALPAELPPPPAAALVV